MDEKKLLDRLRLQCSRREYCTSDIIKKIRKYEGLNEGEIIGKLKDEGYLSDMRYAEAFARDKSSLDGWGPMKIRYALQAKCIDSEAISAALDSVDEQVANGRLDKLLLSKKKSLGQDPDARAKLIRYAMGRGYSYDRIAKSLNSMSDSELD